MSERNIGLEILEGIREIKDFKAGKVDLRTRKLTPLEKEPLAIDISFESENMVVELADGRSLTIPVEWYPRLFHGTPEERQNWQLLGDGYAIEWPDLDEHIGVEGLLAGRRSGESQKSIQRWLDSRRNR